MAKVTGLTAERMLEIEATTIVSGRMLGDRLILTTREGEDIDAGVVAGGGGSGSGGGGAPPKRFNFPNASAVWTCVHPFNSITVSISTFDEFGVEIVGDVTILNATTVQVVWGGPEAGSAIIEG